MTTEEVKVKVGAKRYTVVRDTETKDVLRILAIDGMGFRPVDSNGKLGKQILQQLGTGK